MKYRHHGYRDDDYRKDREKDRREKRGPREIATREATAVIRCWQCGSHQEPESGGELFAACSNCRADLHCCRNCSHFDPGARFQCTKPIEKAYRDKTVRNDCGLFAARQVLDATGRRAGAARPAPPSPDRDSSSSSDPREAFENLFK